VQECKVKLEEGKEDRGRRSRRRIIIRRRYMLIIKGLWSKFVGQLKYRF
jgi:hypothetical protein